MNGDDFNCVSTKCEACVCSAPKRGPPDVNEEEEEEEV